MAEDQQDDSQKTEEPTGKRLQDAREKGQVAKSQEVNHWFVFLGLALFIGVFGPGIVSGIGGVLVVFLERPHAIRLGAGGLEVAVQVLEPRREHQRRRPQPEHR